MYHEKHNAAQPPQERVYTVDTPGGLLDFLLGAVKDKSRNTVKALLTNKFVSVNGKTVTRHDHPLAIGQTVRIAAPAVKSKSALKVLYEDAELLVIDKPAGLLSITTDTEKEKTAYRLMTEHVREKDPSARIFIVHRLDRDTSGVLLAAKNERLKHALQDAWSALVTARGYTAVVEGRLASKSGRVRSFLKETKTHLMYSSGREGDGQEAVTTYTVLREGKGYSLVDVRIETGRKNQIRVHMSELGHPIVGDRQYGSGANPIGRLALHAGLLALTHPFTGKALVFESRTPDSFLSLLKD